MLEPTENDTQCLPDYSKIIAAIEKKFGAKFKLAKSAFRGGLFCPTCLLACSRGAYFYYRFIFTSSVESDPSVWGEARRTSSNGWAFGRDEIKKTAAIKISASAPYSIHCFLFFCVRFFFYRICFWLF